MEGGGLRVAVAGLFFGASAPRRLCHEPRDAIEDDAQDALVGAGCRQVQADLRLHLDHPRGDLDEAQTQRVELGDGKARALRHRGAQAPHHPVGAGMQEQPELVGCGSGAGCAVGGEMRLPRFDVVLGRSAPAVKVRVERLGLATGQIGDDEAGVSTLGTDLDAGDDALHAAPAGGAVKELLEAADLVRFRRRLKTRQRAGFQIRDLLAQRRGGRQPEDEVDIVGAAPVVSDIQAAHSELTKLGVDVSEVFHRAAVGEGPSSGPDPARRSYASFASFSDPDGNRWLVQEVTARLRGRVEADQTTFTSSTEIASALRRAAAAHGEHEKRSGGHHDVNWPDWYTEYIVREQTGQQLPT